MGEMVFLMGFEGWLELKRRKAFEAKLIGIQGMFEAIWDFGLAAVQARQGQGSDGLERWPSHGQL